MKFRHTLFFILLFCLVISCSEVDSTRTIRLGHGLDVSHPVHKAMEKMGDELERLSDGKLNLEIYPSQQLGTERQLLELLQIGSLDMTKVSVGCFREFCTQYEGIGIAFFISGQGAFVSSS